MGYAKPSAYLTKLGNILLVVALPLLWWSSEASQSPPVKPEIFLFLHSIAEMFAIVVAMLIFVTGFRSIEAPREGPIVWLGLAFLGVGLLDGLHTLSYAGMPDALSHNSPHKSILFWLAARMLAAMALLIYVLLPVGSDLKRENKRFALVLMLGLVFAFSTVGLLWPETFPPLFRAGQGLSLLKIILEWLVIGVHLVTLAILNHLSSKTNRGRSSALTYALWLSVASELFFTLLGSTPHNNANVLGHLYKVVAYMFLLRATVNEALRRPLELLKVQNLREKATLAATPDGVIWVDKEGTIVTANQAMESLTGYAPVELVGKNVSFLLPPELRTHHARAMQTYFHAPHGRPMMGMDINLYRRDGQLLPVDISLGYWEDDQGPHAIAYIRDLREHRKFVESLRHQATHDSLTGLPNRWLFQLQLGQALARAERTGRKIAVLFLDLDHFKSVNDTFGHATGDALLVQAGQRIQGILRSGDLMARMGGDEFAILLPDLQHIDAAVSVAIKILASLQDPFDIDGRQLLTYASLGLAFCPDDTSDSETMLRYADMAMYRAKQAGRGTYACYSRDMDQSSHEEMLMHARLKTAMDQQLLSLHYQPQVEISSGAIVGAEALLRWHDSVLGNVSPARFIPIAEVTGLILPLSDWVLETACRQIAAWEQAGTPVRLAINISTQQFQRGDLASKVRAALKRNKARPCWLEIEITESMAMTQPQKAHEQIMALVDIGCSIALDDFGTGYSSLAYLKNLPVSKIKVDRSFVQGLTGQANDDIIVQTIIGMARNLGIGIIAEGVETAAQSERLTHYGCHTAQGYRWYRPMPQQDFEALLVSQFRSSQTCVQVE